MDYAASLLSTDKPVVLAGDAKWPCLWTGCDKRFRRWELRKKHIERDHHAGDMKELDPQPVARQNEVFVYRVRKSIRGQREHCQVLAYFAFFC